MDPRLPPTRPGGATLTVARVGAHVAHLAGDRLALADDTLSLTYAELDERVDRMASALAGLGVGRGDIVCAYLPNSAAYVLVVLAVARAAAVFSPINPRFRAREVAEVLEVARPSVVFTDASRVELIEASARAAGVEPPRIVVVDGRHRDAIALEELLFCPRAVLPDVHDHDYFSLMFTSGTTGRPKGALATHGARMIWVLNAAIAYGLRDDDVYLGTMPQVHSAGLTFTLMHLYVGATIRVLREFDPRAWIERVEGWRVTSCLTVPTMLVMVLEALEKLGGRPDLSSLRRLVTCGSPLQPVTREKTLRRITGELWDYYGSTESNSMTVLRPADQARKLRSVGQPFINVRLRIAGENGEARPAGEVGEVWCRNPSLMTAYLGQPEATAAAFHDGWFRTGDLGYLDDEGYLFLVGRANDIVKTGAINVFPGEVEQVMMAHPAVLDCAVVGLPDEKWGEMLAAFVVLRDGATLDLAAAQRHCTAELADYKKPRRLVIVPQIPKNAGGKTMKAELLAAFGAAAGAA